MAYESTIVSTTADTVSLRRVLDDVAVVGAWPGFVAEEARDGARTTWRTSRPGSRTFPPSGRWEVEYRTLRDDLERPEILLVCTSGRSTIHLTIEVWALAPHVRLIRVGVRHGSAGRLRYAPRKLRRASQEFGKAVAAAAGGEVLERVGVETVQRLGILAKPEDASSPEPLDDPLDPDPFGERGG